MKKALLIIGIILLAAGVLLLAASAFCRSLWRYTYDASASFYARWRRASAVFLAAGVAAAAAGAVCLVVSRR